MGRFLSIGILGVATALTASIVPQFIAFLLSLLENFTPLLTGTRGQLSLVLLLVICWSVRASLNDSLIWAFVGGLLLDLQSILPLGASSLALLIIVFVVNGIAQQLFQLRIVFLLAITALATVFFTSYNLLALVMLGNTYDVPALLRLVLVPTMIYNLVAVLPIYAAVRLIQRRLEGGLQIAPQSLSQAADARAHE